LAILSPAGRAKKAKTLTLNALTAFYGLPALLAEAFTVKTDVYSVDKRAELR